MFEIGKTYIALQKIIINKFIITNLLLKGWTTVRCLGNSNSIVDFETYLGKLDKTGVSTTLIPEKPLPGGCSGKAVLKSFTKHTGELR